MKLVAAKLYLFRPPMASKVEIIHAVIRQGLFVVQATATSNSLKEEGT